MSVATIPRHGLADLFITEALDSRPTTITDYRQEMMAILELAGCMADAPDDVLPRFVDLALEITGGSSAGLSLFDPDSSPGVFHWRYLRGVLSSFDGAATPRDCSPCGVTLDQNGPVLARHPECYYNWIADANIVLPEVLLVPLALHRAVPLGTLWIVSEQVDHFNRAHARAMTELASFVGVALRMAQSEKRLQSALEAQETLSREMSHRVKNLFTIVDGMIKVSARSAVSKDDLAKALSGRLNALASAHSLVSRNLREVGRKPRTGDIGTLLRAVLHPHDDAATPSRFIIRGPKVKCGDRAINGVALVFHELATNAVKYGSLRHERGSVAIRWYRDGGDLVLGWVERSGPDIGCPPTREGFGSKLIHNTVTDQFGGELMRDWKPEGLSVTMRLPIDKLSR